jgi:formylglycine-generating enzyme required for sulfatase activity
MGCQTIYQGTCPADEQPSHVVYLDPFAVDRTEATVASYDACVGAGACSAVPPEAPCHGGDPLAHDHPIACLSWQAAADYCAFAGKRLCTEAEWELAARSNHPAHYPWGWAVPSCSVAVFAAAGPGSEGCGTGDTHAVGSLPDGASPFGALDVVGNVSEWVADWYAADAYATDEQQNPQGPPVGTLKVTRGGTYASGPDDLPTTRRAPLPPDTTTEPVGVRCCRSL